MPPPSVSTSAASSQLRSWINDSKSVGEGPSTSSTVSRRATANLTSPRDQSVKNREKLKANCRLVSSLRFMYKLI